MKWSDVNLQKFWTEIFHIELFPMINEEDDEEIQNFSLLLSTLLMLHKNVKRQLFDAETGLNASRKELLRLKESRCAKCVDFKTEVHIYEKKLQEHENRIKTIANILNLHNLEENCKESQSNTPTSKAFNLVSQMLLGEKSDLRSHTKRSGNGDMDDKEFCKKYKSDNKHSDETASTSFSSELTCVSRNNLNGDDTLNTNIIPETELELIDTPIDAFQDQIRCNTPTKQVLKQSKEVVSPVLNDVKKFSLKRNTPNYKKKLNESVEPCKPSATNITPLSHQRTTLLDEKDEISECDKPSKNMHVKNKQDKKLKENTKENDRFWKLKALSNDHTNIAPKHDNAHNLKQTRLSIGSFSKKINIESLDEFNAGIRMTSTQKIKNNSIQEDENLKKAIEESLLCSENPTGDDNDIVISSPNVSQQKLLGLKQSGRKSDPDITLFVPLHIDEAHGKSNKNSSVTDFVRLQRKETSPSYAYRRRCLRNKEQRKKLEGWDCDDCKLYFQAASDPEKAKQHMNRCSRHRDKFPVRANTPPGFWNPDFPSTQECRQKKLDVTQIDKKWKK